MRHLLTCSIVTLLLNVTCASQAATLFGPTTFSNPFDTRADLIGTVSSGSLNGEDEVFITYSVTRANNAGGDSWHVLAFNATASHIEFLTSPPTDFALLVRTRTDSTDDHQTFHTTSGSWVSGDASSVDFDAVSPAEHAIRITLSGMSSGGFTGSKGVKVEIDHNSSTFGSADRTFDGVFDFGLTDDGLKLVVDTQNQVHTANNLTVFQIPEPSTSALSAVGLLGLLACGRQRRR